MKDRKMFKYSMYDKAYFENLDEETREEIESAFQDLKDAKESGDQAKIDAAKENLRSLHESIKGQN